MRLTREIAIVGGGKWSIGISHPIDCAVYLIDTGAGYIMIDSGCSLDNEKIEENIKNDGFILEDVKIILLTHYHADHACGAAWFHQRTGCRVYASTIEAPYIAIGDDKATSLAGARGKSYPEDFIYPPCECVEGLEDGDKISLGNVTINAFTVPGHSRSDMVFYGTIGKKKCLFSGDAIFAGGEILLQSLYDVSILPYFNGIKAIAKLEVDALFPGHGQFVLNNAQWHINKCLEGFESGLVPKQFHYFI